MPISRTGDVGGCPGLPGSPMLVSVWLSVAPRSWLWPLRGAAAQAPRMTGRSSRHELPPGTVLGDAYRLVRRIAEGGMGTVYEAEQLRLGKRCAVKVMAPELAVSRDALARFHREVEVTSQLNHPHIVQV